MCNIYSLPLNDLKTIRLVQNIFSDTESVFNFSVQCPFKTSFCTDTYLASYSWGIHRDVGTPSCKVVMKTVGSKWKLVWLKQYHIWSKLFYPFNWVIPCIQTDGWKDSNGHSIGIETCLKLMTKIEKFWTDDSWWVLNLVHTSLNLCCLCRRAEVGSIRGRGGRERRW